MLTLLLDSGHDPDTLPARYLLMYHRNLDDIVDHEAGIVGHGVTQAFSNE